MLEKKNTSTTECSKSIVICDIVICNVGTIKCEEKKRGELSNVTKIRLHVMLVLPKSQCDDRTVKCE